MSCPRLGRDDYTIGWICALPVELKAARALLDEQHELPVQRDGDNNSYTVGRIGAHNVVIAVLPAGRIGTNPAATIGSDMSASFRNLRFALMVGIGGGVPSDKHDIRLGDVVVSVPTGRYSGVIQYDMGKALANDFFEPSGFLNMPPTVVLTTVNTLRSLDREVLFKHLSVFDVTSPQSEHSYPGSEQDLLFKAEYNHRFSDDDTCDWCNKFNLMPRPIRDNNPFYHYGTIASGNLVIRDGLKRDKLQKEHGILCFEMEAAGLMNAFPCLVIRGISDYSDSHKNKCWQPYAAATAATYAKILLEYMSPIAQLRDPVLLTKKGRTRLAQKSCFMIPFDRDQKFIDREDIMQEIDRRFKTQRRIALTGIGGIGKSQIAIEYCYRWHEQHPQGHVFWIHATTLERINQAYQDIARELNLPGWDNESVDSFALVTKWLNDDDNGSWLLVLDNADDMETFFGTDLNPSPAKGQQKGPMVTYLPRSSNGSMVITTRDKRVGARLSNRELAVEIPPMDEPEAESLLWSKVPPDRILEKSRSSELLKLLEYLPLAITQAAAYISENSISVEEYLEVFRRADTEMQDLLSVDLPDHRRDFEQRSDMQNSVIRTWKVSFDQIRRQMPRAAEILSLMAVLDRQSIPKILLRKKEEQGTELTTALGTLQAFSLVAAEQGRERFKMHRLVQISTQRWLELHDETIKWQEEALIVLSKAMPESRHENMAIFEALSPHVQTVTRYTFKPNMNQLRATLLDEASFHPRRQGQYNLAYDMVWEAFSIRMKELGAEHPDTLRSMYGLGVLLQRQGKYQAAEDMQQQVLELSRKVQGPKHPHTLDSMYRLANILRKRGKYEAAEKMQRQVLEVSREVLGPEHSDTLTSMYSLADVLSNRGKYDAAEKMQQQVLELLQKVRGPKHPSTLNSMDSLADILHLQGKHEAAEKMQLQVLELSRELLGPEHPDTIDSMYKWAIALVRQGKKDEAENLTRHALEADERVLGPNHPHTLMGVRNLAFVLENQKRYAEALIMYERAYLGYQEKLGLHHRHTERSLKACSAMRKKLKQG